MILLLIPTTVLSQINCDKYPENYIPKDLDDALTYLDCIWSKADKDIFKEKPETEAVLELHFGTGMSIRNAWGLWGSEKYIANYFRTLGIFHPDDMSAIILTSFHRYLNDIDLNLDEQIKFYLDYWEKLQTAELERRINKFNEFSINDTVYFQYNYGFLSDTQENKYDNDLCVAKGLILDLDTDKLLLYIELLESCDEKGIKISTGGLYEQKGDLLILIKTIKENLKIGEREWTNYDIWTNDY